MNSDGLVSDEFVLSNKLVNSGHPMDSSRILLGLIELSRRAKIEEDQSELDSLDGVISENVLRSLLSALHFRDANTTQHVRRTSMLASGLAQYLGWEGRSVKILEVAALLHDIGKVGVPDNILFKPGKLSPSETDLMSLHSCIAIDVLQACCVDHEVLNILSQSKNFYNGASDDYKLIGSEVHQGARILAVADAYDSLRSDRSYRAGKSHEEVIEMLTDSSGTKFDGNIVGALSRWIDADGIPFDTEHTEDNDNQESLSVETEQQSNEANALGQIFSYLYLLESLYGGFSLVDADKNYLIWNTGLEDLLGHSAQEVLTQKWSHEFLALADEDGQPFAEADCPLNQAIATGKPVSQTVQMRRVNGRMITVEMQAVPLFNEHRQLQGVAEIVRDLSRKSKRLHEYKELKMAASCDPLTNLANRGELEIQLAQLISKFSKNKNSEPFSVIFVDVDFFKSINDTFGHSVGDQVLVHIAKLMQHETYSGELVSRYGGEEFVLLCPNTNLEQALRKAERLRIAISRSRIEGISEIRLTASFGTSQSESGDSVESILRRADKALYMAKETGRNKTCSLTNEELLAGEAATNSVEEEQTNPFVFTGSFYACVAADMIVYKLGGFVNDHKAKLIDVTSKHAVIRHGSRRILPFWGKTAEKRPVIIEIEFYDNSRSQSNGPRRGTPEVLVQVKITPYGRIKDSNIFHTRAKRVMSLLRSYFVGD